MLERTDAISNEVLEPSTFVLAYPTAVEVAETCAQIRVSGVTALSRYFEELCTECRPQNVHSI